MNELPVVPSPIKTPSDHRVNREFQLLALKELNFDCSNSDLTDCRLGLLTYEESKRVLTLHPEVMLAWYMETEDANWLAQQIHYDPALLQNRYWKSGLDAPWDSHAIAHLYEVESEFKRLKEEDAIELCDFSSDEDQCQNVVIFSDLRVEDEVFRDVPESHVEIDNSVSNWDSVSPYANLSGVETVSRDQKKDCNISVTREVELSGDQTYPFALEILDRIMSYVPSSFKVAKRFVPYSVASDDYRRAQLKSMHFDPCSGICDSFFVRPSELPSKNKTVSDRVPRSIVRYSRSPKHVYDHALFSVLGSSVTRIYSVTGKSNLISNYKAQVEAVDSGMTQCEREVLTRHLQGILPPRQTTTYTSGLLFSLTKDHPKGGSRWVPPTLVTGPEQAGYSGGCLVDKKGNLTGYVRKQRGTAVLWAWNQTYQSWYSTFPRKKTWTRDPGYHRNLMTSSCDKMSGIMVDTGGRACRHSCCRSRFHPILTPEYLNDATMEDSGGHYIMYHQRYLRCTCSLCSKYVSDRSCSPIRFLRLSYAVEIHHHLLESPSDRNSLLYSKAVSNSLTGWEERQVWDYASSSAKPDDSPFLLE